MLCTMILQHSIARLLLGAVKDVLRVVLAITTNAPNNTAYHTIVDMLM